MKVKIKIRKLPASCVGSSTVFHFSGFNVPFVVEFDGKVADPTHQDAGTHVVQSRLQDVQFKVHHVLRFLARVLAHGNCWKIKSARIV